MRTLGVMRFVIFGAVGLGIGWGVAGFFNVGLVGITAPMSRPPSSPLPGLGCCRTWRIVLVGRAEVRDLDWRWEAGSG